MDNSTPHLNSKGTEKIMQSLKETRKLLYKWFVDDLIKSDVNKFHLLVNTFDKVIRQDNFNRSNSKCKKNSKLSLIINSPLTTIFFNYAKNGSCSREGHSLYEYIKKKYSNDLNLVIAYLYGCVTDALTTETLRDFIKVSRKLFVRKTNHYLKSY